VSFDFFIVLDFYTFVDSSWDIAVGPSIIPEISKSTNAKSYSLMTTIGF